MGDQHFQVGQSVEKVTGDYLFSGHVVSVVKKLNGAVRYVVEDDRRALHIFSGEQLREVSIAPCTELAGQAEKRKHPNYLSDTIVRDALATYAREIRFPEQLVTTLRQEMDIAYRAGLVSGSRQPQEDLVATGRVLKLREYAAERIDKCHQVEHTELTHPDDTLSAMSERRTLEIVLDLLDGKEVT